MNLQKLAADLRSEAERRLQEIEKQQEAIRQLQAAADALAPPQKPGRRWDADQAAAMRREGRSWDDIREAFGLQITRSGIVQRLKKAGYSGAGQPLGEERPPPEEPTKLNNGTRTEAEPFERDLVQTSG